jgi:ankyrin repeat protein
VKSSQDGDTLLHVAVRNDHDKVAELVRGGATDVNAANKVCARTFPCATLPPCVGNCTHSLSPCAYDLQSGETPIHIAAREGHDKVAEVLLQANADVNATDEVRLVALRVTCTALRLTG